MERLFAAGRLDPAGGAALAGVIPPGLSFALRGATAAMVFLALAAIIGLVLWTPLREWLGLPPATRDTATPARRGLVNRSTGVADVSRARFGAALDEAIYNEGEVDASQALF